VKTTALVQRRLTESVAAIREVIGQASLRRAEAAFALSCTAEWAFSVALAVVAYRDGGPSAVGFVTLARMVPSALATPFLTGFADRIRRERVLAVVSLFRTAVIAAAAVLLATDYAAIGVYFLAVLATIAFTVFRPTHSALLPSLCTTTRQLTSANVVRGILDASAALVGPAIAGVLLAVSGPPGVFAASAALSLGTVVALLRIRYEAPRPTVRRHRTLGRDTVEGLRAVAQHRDLAMVFGLGFAQTAVRGALSVFTVVVALELLDTGDAGVAALAAAVGAGGVAGSLATSMLVGSRHLGGWLAIALVLWGAPIAVIGLVPSGFAAFAAMTVVGLGNAIIDVPLFTLPVRLVDDTLLARVFGVFESLVALGVGLGSVLTPVLITAFDLRGALIAVGLVLPILAALCWWRLTALDGRLEVRDHEIAILRSAPMFGQLPVASIEHVSRRARHCMVPAGTILFAQGERGCSFYIVVAGEADVIGDGEIVRTAGPNGYFGEIALIRNAPRTATVRARTELELLELDRDVFLDAIGCHTPSTRAAHAVVAAHLAHFAPMSLRP
jgi:MFS family permease